MMGRAFRWLTLFLVTAGFLAVGLVVFLRNPPREPDRTADVIVEERKLEPDLEPEPSPEPPPREPGRDESSEKTADSAEVAAAPEFRVDSYTVQRGDSLSSIARDAYSAEDRARGAGWLAIYAQSADHGLLDPLSSPIVAVADRYNVRLRVGQQLLIPFYPGDYPSGEAILARFLRVEEEVASKPSETAPRSTDIRRFEEWTATAAARRWLRLAGRSEVVSPLPFRPRESATSPSAPRTTASEPPRAPSPERLAPAPPAPERAASELPAPEQSTPEDPRPAPRERPPQPRATEAPQPERPVAEEPPQPAPVARRTTPDRPAEATPATRAPGPRVLDPQAVEPQVSEPEEREPMEAIQPAISLTEPRRGSFYGETLLIEGRVQASRGVPIGRDRRALEELIVYFDGRREEAEAIYWDVTDGSFRALLRTEELTGSQTVVVEASNDTGGSTSVRVSVHDGNTAPSITLTSPDTEYGYGSFLEIAGRTVDETQDAGQPRGVELIRYEIQPADFAIVQDPVEGEIRPNRDGSFEAVIPTDQFKGTQLVVLVARGVNGAERELSLELPKANTAIPRIDASGGNRQVTLDWSPIPGARDYRVYYRRQSEAGQGAETDRELRLWEEQGATEIVEATPPFRVRRLDNRVRYQFQVVTGGAGREAWSEVVENVPLSGRELNVSATNDFDAIGLSWRPLPSVSRYRVWRKADNEAEYVSVATVEGDEFRDETVRYGIRYAYSIAPDMAGAVMSPPVYGLAASVPQEAITASALSESPEPSAIAVAGEYVVVSDQEGVALLDTWNLSAVTRRGELRRMTQLRAMDTWDRYVIGADETGRVRVVDTNDSSRPRLVHSTGALGVSDVAVVPTSSRVLVFLARNRQGLEVRALEETPTSLRELGGDRGRESHLLSAVAAMGSEDLVYLASAGDGGVAFYTVRPDGTPRLQGTLPEGEVTDLHLIADPDGRPLLLATAEQEFLVISPLPRPEVVSRTPITNASAVRGIAYHDGSLFAYVGSSNGVTVFDLSDPEEPIQFAVTGDGRPVGSLALQERLTGEVTVVAATSEGTAFYEAHTVGRSRVVATVVTPGEARQIRLTQSRRGPTILVADRIGVAVVSARNAVALREGEADPDSYVAVGSDVLGADALVFGRRTLLFVADREEGLFLYDLDRPRAPLAHLSADLRPLDVIAEARSDGTLLAYVLDERWGVVIVDMTDEETPIQRSATRVADPRGFCRVGDQIYIADARAGIVVVDVSNTFLPEIVKSIELPGVRDVHLHQNNDGSLIGLAVTTDGFVVLHSETGRSAELTPRGTYLTQFGERVTVDEEYALVNEGVLGLNILDLSNPDRPRRVSGSDLAYASGAERFGSYAFAVDGSDLQIVEILVPPWLEEATSRR